MNFWPGSKTAADSAKLLEKPASPDSPTSIPDSLHVSHLVLEITRGTTRFRRRPVCGQRFLIGAGVTCDLRIGGESMPALHSLITTDRQGAHLEAIAATPVLVVNGKASRAARLADGDVVCIGDVELVARVVLGHAPAVAPAAAGPAQPVPPIARRATELSALELVELIESEEEQVEQFERAREAGARALLQAAIHRAPQPVASRPDDAPARRVPAPHFLSKRPQVLAARGRAVPIPATEQFVEDLEHMGRQLSSLSAEFKSTSERATEREALYAEATDVLLEAHQKLAGQLEAVVEQVGALHQPSVSVKPRAIA